jgi:membrane-bound inhibitor of C-type lysozyme
MQIVREIKNNWKYLLLSIIIAFFYITLFNAQAGAAELNVNLLHREKIALSSEAEAELMLVDPKAAQKDLIIIDSKKDLSSGIPVKFKLQLESGDIAEGKNYQLLSLIKDGREMIWTDSQKISGADLLTKKEIDIMLSRKPARFLSFYGKKDLKIKFLEGMAQLIIEDEEYILPQQRTASGAKFANSKISVWNKGRELYLEQNNKSYKLSLPGINDLNQKNSEFSELTARGQEPPWQLSLNKSRLKLNYGYLSNQITVQAQNIEKIEQESHILYKIRTNFFRL